MKYACLAGLLPLLLLTEPEKKEPAPRRVELPQPRVPRIKQLVQPFVEKEAKEAQARTLEELQLSKRIPAHFKLPIVNKGLVDPWGGLEELEASGLAIAEAARGDLVPAELLNRLSAAIGKPAGTPAVVKREKKATLDDLVNHLVAVLDKARELHDQAWAKVSAENRKATFDWATRIAEHFGPQVSVDDGSRPVLKNDRSFCGLVGEQVDWAKMVSSAQTLLTLLDRELLADLETALEKATPIKEKIAGVTGDILFKKETRHGLILIGGKGVNTYDLKVPVALLIDLGGDDAYKGTIASPRDVDHPLSVVIDLAGNDTYDGAPCSLATGRVGVGLLADLGGKDTYKLAYGCGGVGLAGVGILYDHDGDDVYTGTRMTQGSAIGGIGLLLDRAGNDQYTSHGFAIGLGGPVGVGAVIDLAGDDVYQCGKHYPSGYNQSDAPNAKPDDPNFQYDCFGLAMGLGRRTFPRSPEGDSFNLAGGLGLVIDFEGKDRYSSSNFSQACGYFFGVGLKMDFAGDDEHAAARYGHASGAHFGMGLFADYAGNDTYTSTGPTYNGACAWDHSVFLFLDAAGDDVYDFKRSAGPGRADIGAWAVFADLGGKDRYIAPGGLGRASQKSLAVFLDAGKGEDDYTKAAKTGDFQPAIGKTYVDREGGVFIDRE
jgi:hypothetical protein